MAWYVQLLGVHCCYIAVHSLLCTAHLACILTQTEGSWDLSFFSNFLFNFLNCILFFFLYCMYCIRHCLDPIMDQTVRVAAVHRTRYSMAFAAVLSSENRHAYSGL
jgi:hypothetical protein